MFARVPGRFIMFMDVVDGVPQFRHYPSKLVSHTELYKRET